MPRLRRSIALVAAAPLALACSSSTTDPSRTASPPPLTASEAGTLAGLVITQAKTAAGTNFSSSLNSDGSFSFSSACPLGGTVAGTLVATPITGAGPTTLGTTLTLTPNACGVGTGARTIFITGDPTEVVQSTLAVSGTGVMASTSTVTGGFKWDGGSCQLHYTATSTLNGLSDTVMVVGTVCGQSVNVTRAF